jgi:hypothetical protein
MCSIFFSSFRVNDPEEADPAFIAISLRTSLGRFQFQSMITETAYPVIGDDDVENLIVLLPDIETQRAIASSYAAAVDDFFGQLNNAYSALVAAQQRIETTVLGGHAEILSVPTFGLVVEEQQEEEENGEPSDPEE